MDMKPYIVHRLKAAYLREQMLGCVSLKHTEKDQWRWQEEDRKWPLPNAYPTSVIHEQALAHLIITTASCGGSACAFSAEESGFREVKCMVDITQMQNDGVVHGALFFLAPGKGHSLRSSPNPLRLSCIWLRSPVFGRTPHLSRCTSYLSSRLYWRARLAFLCTFLRTCLSL